MDTAIPPTTPHDAEEEAAAALLSQLRVESRRVLAGVMATMDEFD